MATIYRVDKRSVDVVSPYSYTDTSTRWFEMSPYAFACKAYQTVYQIRMQAQMNMPSLVRAIMSTHILRMRSFPLQLLTPVHA